MAPAMNRAEVGLSVLSAVDQRLDVIEIPFLTNLDRLAAEVATVIPLHDAVADLAGSAVIVGLSDPLFDCPSH
jgi:hypothetical protein